MASVSAPAQVSAAATTAVSDSSCFSKILSVAKRALSEVAQWFRVVLSSIRGKFSATAATVAEKAAAPAPATAAPVPAATASSAASAPAVEAPADPAATASSAASAPAVEAPDPAATASSAASAPAVEAPDPAATAAAEAAKAAFKVAATAAAKKAAEAKAAAEAATKIHAVFKKRRKKKISQDIEVKSNPQQADIIQWYKKPDSLWQLRYRIVELEDYKRESNDESIKEMASKGIEKLEKILCRINSANRLIVPATPAIASAASATAATPAIASAAAAKAAAAEAAATASATAATAPAEQASFVPKPVPSLEQWRTNIYEKVKVDLEGKIEKLQSERQWVAEQLSYLDSLSLSDDDKKVVISTNIEVARNKLRQFDMRLDDGIWDIQELIRNQRKASVPEISREQNLVALISQIQAQVSQSSSVFLGLFRS
jgi:hypothetical protein